MMTNRRNKNMYLRLFASIQLTKGHKRTLLTDFDRKLMHLIPNALYDFVLLCKQKPLQAVLQTYDKEAHKSLEEYISFLEKHEYAFFTRQPKQFPDINFEWKSPNCISNAVLDIDDQYRHDFDYIINVLNSLGCKALDIRIFKAVEHTILADLLDFSKHSCIRSIRLMMPYDMYKNNISYSKLLKKFPKVTVMIFHGSSANSSNYFGSQSILFIKEIIDSEMCCGYVSEELMICNIEMFSEAQNYNSCLNKKLSIDKKGMVKNCNALKQNFGYYKSIDIKQLIKHEAQFTKLWKISKDQVEVCRDCEFRYVCVDCRAKTKNGEIMSKPLECTYDPYTATHVNAK